MQKAESILSKVNPEHKVDILILSEMVFTGYKFSDKKDIEPYLEKAGEGPTFEWCSNQAKRLTCWVFCGYPEIVHEDDGTIHLYNSQMVINPQG